MWNNSLGIVSLFTQLFFTFKKCGLTQKCKGNIDA